MEVFDNRYEQEHLLGRGAFSEVWKVKDKQTGVTLALKIYNPTTGAGQDGNEMLTREFALMVNASHKNLLRPLFFATCDNSPYLILPYCERGNIGNMIGKMSEEEGWKLLRDTASALAYLHSLKPPILHQDIKPANILLGDNGDYMLTDFGVSTQLKATLSRVSNQELALYSAGTISYMAPERFSRNNLPIMANDIYSLGSTAYEMLSGYLPFGNDGGLLQRKGAEVPELQGDFSPLLKKTLEDCLETEPSKRPKAAELEEIANNALRHPESRYNVPNPAAMAKATRLQLPDELLRGGVEPKSNMHSSMNASNSQMNATVAMNSGMGQQQQQQLSQTVVIPSDDPADEEPKSKKGLYAALAGVLCLCLMAGAYFLFFNKAGEEAVISPEEQRQMAEKAEYEECTRLIGMDIPDSVRSGFVRLQAFAESTGNKDAIAQVAATYFLPGVDPETDRRQKNMGWLINQTNGYLESPDLNKEAVRWFNKSIAASDSSDFRSILNLILYDLNQELMNIKGHQELPGQASYRSLLERARKEALSNGDRDYVSMIDNLKKDLQISD